MRRGLLVLAMLWVVCFGHPAMAQPDVYIKDTPFDSGIEPNPDSGPMWVSEDIWVRRSPDPGYQAEPFMEFSPPWFPLPHQDPEYRDPIFSLPNYIYVRVRNRGDVASTGNERLRIYWAKASTGLSWDSQWVDYLASDCGPTRLYGGEVTKPRKNAATATQDERDAYRDAILAVGTSPQFEFLDGVSFWHKQNTVHLGGSPNRHGTLAFLPWHREFINRYEILLQKADPTVKLLYWDWTTDPENSTGGFNFFTPSFMGASGRGTGGTSIGAPFIPALAPPAVFRNLSPLTQTPADPDASLLSNPTFALFADDNEQVPNHNSAHGYVGGGGNLNFPSTAAEDPFFFLLHGNVDRLWAQWQRDPAMLSRLESATTYGNQSGNANLNLSMGPWDGSNPNLIEPWTATPMGGQIVSKTPKHASVVSPPIYDSAPLAIPALEPGEAVIVQIPWYPPDPSEFGCFNDPGHVCLLARIETSISSPFGMTFPEGQGVYRNTQNNNNIAWKNLSVVDDFAGPNGFIVFVTRNTFDLPLAATLQFRNAQGFGPSFFDSGRITVDLGPELFQRWINSGSQGEYVEPLADGTIQILGPEASLGGLEMQGGEAFSVGTRFELFDDYTPIPEPLPEWDIIQLGTPEDPAAVLGGNRYEVDFRRLDLIPMHSDWLYWDEGPNPDPNWIQRDYDDTAWRTGRARLGFGRALETTIDRGAAGAEYITRYFRRSFDVEDPDFYRTLLLRLNSDDGAIVYLNGTEIHRFNMPEGSVEPNTPALGEIEGLREIAYGPVFIPEGFEVIQSGQNVVAVEVHQAISDQDDLSFDLQLSANGLTDRFPPEVGFDPSLDGALFQIGEPISVRVEALDLDSGGAIGSVSLFMDGEQVGVADTEAPYDFELSNPGLGSHRLRAVATDTDLASAPAFATISVVTDVPPSVQLLQPIDMAMFEPGVDIPLLATASDPGGYVVQVDFYAINMETLFTDPPENIATVGAPPFGATWWFEAPGHYMIYAVATDDGGNTSQSIPVHVHAVGDPVATVFADGFESGDVGSWSTSYGGS